MKFIFYIKFRDIEYSLSVRRGEEKTAFDDILQKHH